MTEAEKVTPAQVIAFLNGEGMLEGKYFGERNPPARGVFWWRKYLPLLTHTAGDVEPVRAKLLQKADDAERVHAMFVHGITPADLRAALYAHPPAQAPTEQRQSEPSGDAVPVPQHADQAALMVLLGTDWLKQNAPERLRPEPSGDVVKMREAAEEVAARAFDHYRARNGRMCRREGDDGEKCWIVPYDAMEDLRNALSRPEAGDQEAAGDVEG